MKLWYIKSIYYDGKKRQKATNGCQGKYVSLKRVEAYSSEWDFAPL